MTTQNEPASAASAAETPTPMPTVLLVPGMWHGGWAWHKVEAELAARGIPNCALTFPGRHRRPGEDTFAGHCEFLREQVEAIEGPVVIVAHSYGGAVVTEAADPALVDALIFVAAFDLDPGESVADVIDGRDGAEATADTIGLVDGYLEVDRETAFAGFYHDCDPAEAEAAFARLTPEFADTRSSKVTRSSWRDIRSHFVVCTDDRAVPVQLQWELAGRVDSVSEIASSHSPMMSHPVELADAIEGVVRGVVVGA